MTVRREDLDRAVADGLVTRAQADALWERTDPLRRLPPPRLPPARAALAAGVGAVAAGLLAAVLMAVWEGSGPGAGLAVALVEGAALTGAARVLGRREGLAPVAAVLAALAVALAPAAVRAGQAWAGVLDHAAPPATTFAAWVTGPLFLPAAAAAVAALAALWAIPAPLLSGVLVVTLWGWTLSAAPVVFGPAPTWAQHAILSALVGALAILAGVAVDGRLRRDHARWLYCVGLAAFCGGVSTLHGDAGLSLLAGLLTYAALLPVGLFLGRRCFAVFGAVGVASGLARFADELLVDALVPPVFVAIAVALGAGAFLYARVAPAWERAAAAALPEHLRRWIPPRAR